MRAFILRHNIARFKALLEEEEHVADRRILRELLAKALRDQAVPGSQHEGFPAELDLTQTAAQHLIFRDEFAASREPYLLLDPRKGLYIVDINEGLWNGLHDILVQDCTDNPEDPTASAIFCITKRWLNAILSMQCLSSAMMCGIRKACS